MPARDRSTSRDKGTNRQRSTRRSFRFAQTLLQRSKERRSAKPPSPVQIRAAPPIQIVSEQTVGRVGPSSIVLREHSGLQFFAEVQRTSAPPGSEVCFSPDW